jgi:hypothetical protein
VNLSDGEKAGVRITFLPTITLYYLSILHVRKYIDVPSHSVHDGAQVHAGEVLRAYRCLVYLIM